MMQGMDQAIHVQRSVLQSMLLRTTAMRPTIAGYLKQAWCSSATHIACEGGVGT